MMSCILHNVYENIHTVAARRDMHLKCLRHTVMYNHTFSLLNSTY